jgi:hypothetical protein
MNEAGMRDGGGVDDLDLDAVSLRVVSALERKPEVDVPAGFAARVAAQLPARRVAAVTPARYGMMAIRIGIAALVVALVAVGMHSSGRPVFGITLEWILCAELVGLAVWQSGVRSFNGPRA